MNWSTYEELVKDIYEKLGASQGVQIVCWGRDCKVLGKSGVEHQIDVYAKHSDGMHTYKTAIECKYWDRRRPKDDVTKLAEIIEDAGIEKGVIVSKLGFTEDAIAFAKYKNISLVELREPTEADWEGRVKDVHLRFTALIPVPTQFQIDVVQTSEDQQDQAEVHVDATRMTIEEPGMSSVKLSDLINRLINTAEAKSAEDCLIRHEFQRNTELHVEGSEPTKIAAIQFLLHFETIERESVIKGEDHVSMVMFSLFDKRRFIISPDGEIRESEANQDADDHLPASD